jgi:transcription initiation factor TFIIH subunit 4
VFYYPTELALTLSSSPSSVSTATSTKTAGRDRGGGGGGGGGNADAAAGDASIGGGGGGGVGGGAVDVSTSFILIDTTFRVYAFTQSPFHFALLSTFLRIDLRLPNMIMGTLTKESVRRAFVTNISSREILAYLTAHAHPQALAMAARGAPPLPPNVSEQITLWERERLRYTAIKARLITEFASVAEFVDNAAFLARTDGHLLLSDEENLVMVVSETGFAALRAFRKQAKAAAAGGNASGGGGGGGVRVKKESQRRVVHHDTIVIDD